MHKHMCTQKKDKHTHGCSERIRQASVRIAQHARAYSKTVDTRATLQTPPTITLLLHCCCTLVTLFSHYSYTVLTLFSHCSHAVLTLFSHCSHSVLTLFSHYSNTVLTLFSHYSHTILTLLQMSFCDSELNGCRLGRFQCRFRFRCSAGKVGVTCIDECGVSTVSVWYYYSVREVSG
jgi:hypothetical protein